jgi:hypothetical protein
MSNKYKFWHKTVFWENLKKTIAIFAAPGIGIIDLFEEKL